MFTGGTELTGRPNVYWRNRAANPVKRRKAVPSVLQGTGFFVLTICTVVLAQYPAAVLLDKPTCPQSGKQLPAFFEILYH